MSIQNKFIETCSKERILIDYYRGIAVFLMLWGHSIQYCCGGQFDFFENAAFKFIYSFHMPLFMLISGYLFFYSEQKRNLSELIISRTKNLLYPIFMCSTFNIIITQGVVILLQGNYKSILGASPIYSLWFLWSVLACSIVTAFSVKISNKSLLQMLFLFLGIAVLAILPTYRFNVYMYPFFLIGYFVCKVKCNLAERNDRTKSVKVWLANNSTWRNNRRTVMLLWNVGGVSICLLFVIMLMKFNKEHYIYTSGLMGGESISKSARIDLYRWLIGLAGSAATIWVARNLFEHIERTKVGLLIKHLGKESLPVYALSSSLLSYWLPVLMNKLLIIFPDINWNSQIIVYNLVFTPGIAILYSLLILSIIKVLRKYGAYTLLFGK